MTQLHWLEVSEYASLSLSTIGIVTAAVTQQIVYAVAPLTLTIGLNIANRERLKYLNQQDHRAALVKLDLLIDPLRQRLENFDSFTQKLSTTTGQQIEQLRNNQQYSLDVITQRITKVDNLTQNLTKTTQQQIQELQRLQQEDHAEAFNQHLTQLDALTEQLSINTQNQIEPLNQKLSQLDTLTQNLSKTTQQQLQELQHYQQEYNVNDIRQRLVQLDNLAQQLSTSTQKQIEPLSQRLTQLDALTQNLSKITQQQIQELQRNQQEFNIKEIRQRLIQVDTLTQKLSTDTHRQIEELRNAIAQIQTEMQVLTFSLTLIEQQSHGSSDNRAGPPKFEAAEAAVQNSPSNALSPQVEEHERSSLGLENSTGSDAQVSAASEAIVPVPPQAQQISFAQNSLPVVLGKDSNQEQSLSTTNSTAPVSPQGKDINPQVQETITKAATPDVTAGQFHTNSSTSENPQVGEPFRSLPRSENPPRSDALEGAASPISELRKYHLTSKRILTGHSDKVISVTFSPDGQTLASGSHDKTIKIWNLTSNEPRTLRGHKESSYFGGVNSVAFSPNGKTLASGCNDKTIKLWDTLTGREICTFIGHEDKVYSIVFSPDGKILASGSKDKTIKIWSIEKYKGIYTIPGHADEVLCVAFSQDGKILASGGALNDKTIKIWYLAENKFLTLKGHSDLFGGINSVAFSPDGKTLASGSTDKTIKIWQLSNGKEINTLTGHSDQVYSVAFSPDGKTLASSSKDKTIRLWQVDTGKELLSFTGNEEPVYCVAFSPDGKTLASGNGDKTITIFSFH